MDLTYELYDKITKNDIKYIEFVRFEPKNHLYEIGENVMAINKKELAQLYLKLKPRIMGCFREKNVKKEDFRKIMALTFICLLMTHENITAVNRRKAILSQSDPALLLEEMNLISVILSSPLKKQTKSFLLWEHRRWLLKKCALNDIYRDYALIYSGALEYSEKDHRNMLKDFEESFAGKDVKNSQKSIASFIGYLELFQVFISSHRHPTNYYSHSHARWVLDTFYLDSNKTAEMIFNQCKLKVSDISRWSLLLHLLIESPDDTLVGVYREKTIELGKILSKHETMNWFLTFSEQYIG